MSEELKNVQATLKWFKMDKGYGFVRFADGNGEAFLHSSVVAGLEPASLTEGTIIVCDVVEGAKGPQVSAIHSITPAEPKPKAKPQARQPRAAAPADAATAEAGAPKAERRNGRRSRLPDQGALSERKPGSIRWYNLDSQSGIIDPWDGGEGVFFDRSILRRSGLDIVADGEEVWFVAYDTENGPVAETVELS